LKGGNKVAPEGGKASFIVKKRKGKYKAFVDGLG